MIVRGGRTYILVLLLPLYYTYLKKWPYIFREEDGKKKVSVLNETRFGRIWPSNLVPLVHVVKAFLTRKGLKVKEKKGAQKIEREKNSD